MSLAAHSLSHRAFTLVELLAVIALIAALVTGALYFTASYIQYAQQNADKQTLTVLNDAITRYKTQGGGTNAFTAGAPIGHIISALQTTITWAGMGHQVLKSGITYPARSLSAAGNNAQYHFYKYNSSQSETPGLGVPTNSAPYGIGVAYITNDVTTDYSLQIWTTGGAAYYAVQPSGYASPVIYANSGTTNTLTGSASSPSCKIWTCKGAADPTPYGAISHLTLPSSNNLTSVNVSGCTSLYQFISASNTLTSVDLSGLTALNTVNTNSSTGMTSINVTGCTALNYLYCYNQAHLTSIIGVKGLKNLVKLQCHVDPLLASLDVSGCTSLNYLTTTSTAAMTINVTGCSSLPARSPPASTNFTTDAGATVIPASQPW